MFGISVTATSSWIFSYLSPPLIWEICSKFLEFKRIPVILFNRAVGPWNSLPPATVKTDTVSGLNSNLDLNTSFCSPNYSGIKVLTLAVCFVFFIVGCFLFYLSVIVSSMWLCTILCVRVTLDGNYFISPKAYSETVFFSIYYTVIVWDRTDLFKHLLVRKYFIILQLRLSPFSALNCFRNTTTKLNRFPNSVQLCCKSGLLVVPS